jgi:hypothetical protein
MLVSINTFETTYVGPNFLFKLEASVKGITIGPVRAILADQLREELAQRVPHLELKTARRAQSKSVRFAGKIIEVTMPPICWVVTVTVAEENVEEEARWLVDVAISLLRLHYISQPRLFPRTGEVEPRPLHEGLRDSVGFRLRENAVQVGGFAHRPCYQIDQAVEEITRDNAFVSKSRLIFFLLRRRA